MRDSRAEIRQDISGLHSARHHANLEQVECGIIEVLRRDDGLGVIGKTWSESSMKSARFFLAVCLWHERGAHLGNCDGSSPDHGGKDFCHVDLDCYDGGRHKSSRKEVCDDDACAGEGAAQQGERKEKKQRRKKENVKSLFSFFFHIR